MSRAACCDCWPTNSIKTCNGERGVWFKLVWCSTSITEQVVQVVVDAGIVSSVAKLILLDTAA